LTTQGKYPVYICICTLIRPYKLALHKYHITGWCSVEKLMYWQIFHFVKVKLSL
jgi:hypothetical protein